MPSNRSQSEGPAVCRLPSAPATCRLPPAVCRLPSAPATCFCLLLLVFLTASQVHAQGGSWKRQSTGTLASLHSLFFLDQNRGWAVGSRGTFLVTENGGQSWKAQPRPSEDVLRDIYFADELKGWIVCDKDIYNPKSKDQPRTYLMSTTDGGKQWKKLNIQGSEVEERLVRAVFRPNGRGWTFGEGGVVYTSNDAGENWIRLQAPTRHLLLGGTFIDDDRGWIVGAGATILQTSDGGETWHLSYLPQAKGIRFNATSFVDNRVGWAVGSGGTVYRTLNGGRTWQAQNSGVSADLLDVKFLDALEGWAVGAEGTLIYTSDGGLHWSIEQSDTPHALERVFFADRKHGWAVGIGGTILSYVREETPSVRR